MSPAFERLYVQVKADSDLQTTFAKDAKAADKFDKKLSGLTDKDRKVNVEVETSGTAATMAALKAVDKAADSVDGRDVTVDVNIDKKGLGDASAGLKDLSSSMRSFNTVAMGVAGIPAVIAGIGALPAVATAGAGAVGQLSLALGQGLAGAAAIGGTAVYGAIGGLKAYTAVISSTITASRAAYEATHKQRVEMFAQHRQTILNTEASIDFNTTLDGMSIKLTKLQAAIGNKVFPAFTKELNAWGPLLDKNRGKIAQTSGELAGIAAHFSKFVRSAQGGDALARTFDFISGSATRAASAISNLGQGGFLVFQHLIGPATLLQNQIVALANRFDMWTASAQGSRQIVGVITLLQSRMYALIGIAKNLGAGLIGVFKALNFDGGPQRLLFGLQGIANGFANIMQKGNGGRLAIINFMRSSQPALNQIKLLVGTVWREFGILAVNVAKAGQSSGKMGTLASVIKSVRESITPLRKLFQDTFIALGPVLADLVPELARLGQTFLGTTGPLQGFLGSITSVLRVFNGLPTPVRNGVAALVAFKAITGGLGIGGLVTGVGRLATQYWAMSRASRASALAVAQSNLALKGSAGASAAAGAASAGAATKTGMLARVGGTVAVAFGGLVAVLTGPLVLALAAVAVAAVVIYKNWGRISAVLKPAVDGFKAFYSFVRPFAAALGGAVVGALKAFAGGLLSVIAPGLKLEKGAKGVSDSVGDLARRAIPPVIAALKSMTKWLKDNEPAIRAVGKAVGEFLVKGFKDGIAVIRTIGKVINALKHPLDTLKAAFETVRKFAGKVWNAIKVLIGDALEAAGRKLIEWKNKAVSWVQSLPGAIGQKWSKFWQAVSDWLAKKKDGMLQTLGNWKSKATTWVQSLPGAIGDKWNSFWQKVANWLAKKKEGMLTTLSNWKQKAVSWVKSLPQAIGKLWNKLWQGMANFLIEKKDGMLQTVSNLSSGLVSGFTAIVGFINKVLSAVGLPTINISGGTPSEKSQASKGLGPGSPAAGQATGGVVGRGGRQLAGRAHPYYMRDGGLVAQGATGGVADGRTPHAVFGEVKKKESFAVHGEMSSLPYAESWADSVDMKVVPKSSGFARRPKIAPDPFSFGREDRDWFGAHGGSTANFPPQASGVRVAGSDGIVSYGASSDASSAASAGAAMWKGLVKAGGNETFVDRSQQPLGGGRGAYTTGPKTWLGPNADQFHAGHEFGHTLGLGHGGSGIMGGQGRTIGGPSQADFDAIQHYYGGPNATAGGSAGGSTGFSAPSGYSLPPLQGSGAIRPWTSAVLDVVRAVTWKAGGNPNSYSTHPGGAENSSDWWGMGGRGNPIDKGTGDKVHSTLLGSFGDKLNWIIWQGMIQDAGGTRPYNDPSDKHYDHVHGTILSPGKSFIGGGQQSVWDTIGNALWNRLVQPRVNKLAGSLSTGKNGVFGDIGGGLVKNTAEKIKQYIIGASGGSGGSSGSAGGKSPSGLTLGDAVAQGGWSGNLARTAIGVAWEESSAKADAVNGQYKGLFQVGEAAAQDVQADYNRLFEPVYNASVAYQYYRKIGSWSPWEAYPPSNDSMSRGGTAVTGYKRGGVVPGPPDQPSRAILHGGELVVPSGGFERIHRGMDSWRSSASGPGSTGLGGEAMLSTDAEGLREELRGLRRDVQRLAGQVGDEVGGQLMGKPGEKMYRKHARTISDRLEAVGL